MVAGQLVDGRWHSSRAANTQASNPTYEFCASCTVKSRAKPSASFSIHLLLTGVVALRHSTNVETDAASRIQGEALALFWPRDW
jgi:hypothetical protein